MKTVISVAILNVCCFFFGLLVASLPAMAKETACADGYDRKVSQVGNVKVIRCVAKKDSPEVCQTVVTAGGFERRCYRQRSVYTINAAPLPAYKKTVNPMTAEELLDELQKKGNASDDPDVNRAIELLNLIQEGKKRSKPEKDNRVAKR